MHEGQRRTAAVTVLTDLRREAMLELLQLHELIDLAIPRGGEGLIRFVAEHARVPVIKHYKGCATCSWTPAPTSARPSTCWWTASAAGRRRAIRWRRCWCTAPWLTRSCRAWRRRWVSVVQLRADAQAQPLLPGSTAATEEDYAAEFLDLVLAVRVVDDLDAAIAHIRTYTSDHTEVIATEDTGHAERFVNALRSAVVMVNASSRFSDGGQLGGAVRSVFPPRACTPTARWAWKPSPLNDLSCAAKGDAYISGSTRRVDALRGKPRCRPRPAPPGQAPTKVGSYQVVGLHHLAADADRPCVIIHVQRGGLAAHQAFGQPGAGAQIGGHFVEAGQGPRQAAFAATEAGAVVLGPGDQQHAGAQQHQWQRDQHVRVELVLPFVELPPGQLATDQPREQGHQGPTDK